MTTRREFTNKITSFIQRMISEGEQPIIDYCMRSSEEQNRLYTKKLSKCDGIHNFSKHQMGLACDIYLWNELEKRVDYEWQTDKSTYWHRIWVDVFGGHELIQFTDNDGNVTIDHPHFEAGKIEVII